MPTNFTKHTNYAKGELQSDITASSVSFVLTLGEGSKFPTTGLGNIFRGAIWGADFINPEEDATRELFTAYRESGDTFRFVLRGAENTTARDWLATSNIALVISSAKLDEIESAINTVEGDVDTAVTDLNSHINNENNPHATSLSQLEDANIDTPTNGQALVWNGTEWVNTTIEGSGDVIGNTASQDDEVVLYDGPSGKVIKTSGKKISNAGLDNNANKIAINSEVLAYVNNLVSATVKLQGDWDASTNTPDITGTTKTGYAWRVSVNGNTDIGGITDWRVGDLVIKTDTGWMKIDNEDISALWGNISGSLANQTDLKDALDAKLAITNKASGSDIDAGTDNDKYVTSKAIADSKLSFIDGVETLTNKTLTNPIITGVVNSGGALSDSLFTIKGSTETGTKLNQDWQDENGFNRMTLGDVNTTNKSPALKIIGLDQTEDVEIAMVQGATRNYGGYFLIDRTTSDFHWVNRKNLVDSNAITVLNTNNNVIEKLTAPQGFLINGKIVRTVDGSGKMTIAIKTLADADPSDAYPVYIRIGNTVRTLASALSIGLPGGIVSFFNTGSTELNGKEVDYFVALIWEEASSIIRMGITRRPSGVIAGDWLLFGANQTKENVLYDSKYNNTGSETLASSSEVEIIGRFNAIQSSTYTWSIPATDIIINRPIFETRWLDWTPTLTLVNAPTSLTTHAKYKISGNKLEFLYNATGTANISDAGDTFRITEPFTPVLISESINLFLNSGASWTDNNSFTEGTLYTAYNTSLKIFAVMPSITRKPNQLYHTGYYEI